MRTPRGHSRCYCEEHRSPRPYSPWIHFLRGTGTFPEVFPGDISCAVTAWTPSPQPCRKLQQERPPPLLGAKSCKHLPAIVLESVRHALVSKYFKELITMGPLDPLSNQLQSLILDDVYNTKEIGFWRTKSKVVKRLELIDSIGGFPTHQLFRFHVEVDVAKRWRRVRRGLSPSKWA